jgi:hypothetical protein
MHWPEARCSSLQVFWVTYLPISLWAMHTNWNGLYLAEPRWRLAAIFAVSGLLLQTELFLLRKPAAYSWGNLVALALVAATQVARVLKQQSL